MTLDNQAFAWPTGGSWNFITKRKKRKKGWGKCRADKRKSLTSSLAAVDDRLGHFEKKRQEKGPTEL